MTNCKTFTNSIVALPTDGSDAPQGLVVNAAEAFHMEEPFKVHFSYALSKKRQSDLEIAIASGKVLPASEIAVRISDEKPDMTKLTEWLNDNGYRINHVAPDGIYATATAFRNG